jgi:hypothetical protein
MVGSMSRTGRRSRLRRVVALVALLSPAAALAATPLTGEILVNTTTDGFQEDPAVAMDADGDFAVAWETPDADLEGIVLRRFSAAGSPLGDEVTANAAPEGDQDDPAIASNPSGDLVVAWDVGDEAVKERVFTATGRAGREIDVEATAGGLHESGAVAVDAVGDFVVVWASFGTDGYSDVLARTFDSKGVPQSPDDIPVNTTTASDQDQPTVAMSPDGDFVVAWESLDQDGDGEGVFARRFSAGGRPRGGEIPVTATRAGDQLLPAVAGDRSGSFVVAWEDSDADGGGILARRFDASGTAAAGELAVNQTTTGDQFRPAVAMDTEGGFVIGWEGNGPGDADGVFVREFNAAGAAAAGEELVNASTALFQERPGVARDADGDFVATWQSEESQSLSLDVFARRFGRSPSGGTRRQPVIRRLRLRTRRGRAIIASVGCVSDVCRVRASGSVSVPRAARRKTFRLRGNRATLRRGRGRITLRLSRRALRAALLQSGTRASRRRVSATVSVTGTDAAGGRTRLSRSIRFRPRGRSGRLR